MATAHDAKIAMFEARVASLEARLEDKQQHIEHLAQAMRLLENRQDPAPARRHWRPFGKK